MSNKDKKDKAYGFGCCTCKIAIGSTACEDCVQGPEQPPSMLKSLCGNNGYDMILPEAEEAVTHTKGEWEQHAGRKKFQEARFIVAVKSNGSRVFVAKAYGHEGQPVEANAKLIAEAPETKRQRDMLLGVLLKYRSAYSKVYGINSWVINKPDLEAAIKDCEDK